MGRAENALEWKQPNDKMACVEVVMAGTRSCSRGGRRAHVEQGGERFPQIVHGDGEREAGVKASVRPEENLRGLMEACLFLCQSRADLGASPGLRSRSVLLISKVI